MIRGVQRSIVESLLGDAFATVASATDGSTDPWELNEEQRAVLNACERTAWATRIDAADLGALLAAVGAFARSCTDRMEELTPQQRDCLYFLNGVPDRMMALGRPVDDGDLSWARRALVTPEDLFAVCWLLATAREKRQMDHVEKLFVDTSGGDDAGRTVAGFPELRTCDRRSFGMPHLGALVKLALGMHVVVTAGGRRFEFNAAADGAEQG